MAVYFMTVYFQRTYFIFRTFPTIMNQQNAKKYEDQFNSDFAEYEKMKPSIDRVCAVFDSLEKDMRSCKEGTKEFKEIYKSAMNEYKRQVQKGTGPESKVDGHVLDCSENKLSSAKVNRKVVKSGRQFPRDDIFWPVHF